MNHCASLHVCWSILRSSELKNLIASNGCCQTVLDLSRHSIKQRIYDTCTIMLAVAVVVKKSGALVIARLSDC
jgi:hypothetical protein